ncbi:hypothetical protein [Ferrovibrio sp.]|uniref:hypothetical protein n=1 Tax=Ferrovibrio sp. TaxID=1917215 RepID=UPI0035ADB8A2
MPIDPTNQAPARPPGYLRRLWQALGRYRAGRLLRLAIIAVVGWMAVESASLFVRWRMAAIDGAVQNAILWSTAYATGLRVQTAQDVATLAQSPIYPLPPDCLKEASRKNFMLGSQLIDYCLGPEGFDHFQGGCLGEIPWAAPCRRYYYNIHLFHHPESLERLISGIIEPCRHLPSPERIAQATQTGEANAASLHEAWRTAGCDGKSRIAEYWFQLDFMVANSADNHDLSNANMRMILLVPTTDRNIPGKFKRRIQ